MQPDLVCGKQVESDNTRFFTDYNNAMYYFCSAECKRAFDDHPDRYIQQQASATLGIK